MAWDGSAHLAILQAYDSRIYPDVFGWLFSYFAGMPFPLFYPPLLYWLSASAHKLGAPLDTSLKCLVLGSEFALPPLFGWLSFLITNDRLTSLLSTCTSVVFLYDQGFVSQFAGGLTYSSTINDGLYSHPLGICFFLVWLCLTVRTDKPGRGSSCLSQGILMSFTILSSIFAALVLVPFLTSLTCLLLRRRKKQSLYHLLAAVLACLLLTAFWTEPVLSTYRYFATVPFSPPLRELTSRVIILWLFVGAYGSYLLSLNRSIASRMYVIALLLLGVLCGLGVYTRVVFLPFQTARMVSALLLLLSLPAAKVLSALLHGALEKFREVLPLSWTKRSTSVGASLAVLTIGLFITPSHLNGLLYKGSRTEEIQQVLSFAGQHPHASFLLENPPYTPDRYEARALSAYLGQQGDSMATIVFREASPSAFFFIPLQQALSGARGSFGISSFLSEDDGFLDQPTMNHLEQARELGVRYIVCLTSELKNSISQALPSQPHYDIGRWRIFDIGVSRSRAEILQFAPALIFTSLNLKERRTGEASFIRFAEETFASRESSVVVALAKGSSIEQLTDLGGFGALVIDDYRYKDGALAAKCLISAAREHPVILLESDDVLFKTLLQTTRGIANIFIVRRRPTEAKGAWITGGRIEEDLSTEVQKTWETVQQLLEKTKTETPGWKSQIDAVYGENRIDLYAKGSGGKKTPVLLRNTFHPNWERADGKELYTAMPFFTLTFVDEACTLRFTRSPADKLSLCLSILTLCTMAIYAVWRSQRS